MGPLEQACRSAAASCAWSLLASVGMSSADGRRVPFSVAPEDSLMIASIGATIDSRLGEEARDWFVEFDDLVSRPVLKHRVRRLGELEWSAFATPLATVVRGALPGVATSGGDRFPRTGKSRRAITGEAAFGLLRYRAAFGTQARADVLFALAVGDAPGRRWTADALARSTGYVKSGVRQVLDRLVEAGIVRQARIGNADWFELNAAKRLVALLGPTVGASVDTQVVAPVLGAAIAAARLIDGDGDPAVFVGARSMFGDVERELAELAIQLPAPTHEFDRGRRELVATIRQVATQLADPTRPRWPL